MRVALFPNFSKTGAAALTMRIAEYLVDRGIGVVVSPEVREVLGVGEKLEPSQWAEIAEFCVVLGGDGTLLSAVRAVAPGEIPLLGVNLGRLGFLTEVETPDLFATLDTVLAGGYDVEERAMLEAKVIRSDTETPIRHFGVLNEVVVAKGPFARLVQVNLWVDGNYVDTFPGDGIIIATPTGSTAYSLSAGGPIISPSVECVVVTPIAPHTLYSRPMVIADTASVRIGFSGYPEDMFLTVDGQAGTHLTGTDLIEVKKSPRAVRLVRRKRWNFFDVLRKKMKETHLQAPDRDYSTKREGGRRR